MSESEKIRVQTVPERPADIEVTISLGTEAEIVAQSRHGYTNLAAALTDLPRAADEFVARAGRSFLESITAETFAERSDV